MDEEKCCLCGSPMEYEGTQWNVERWECPACKRLLYYEKVTGIRKWYTFESSEQPLPVK